MPFVKRDAKGSIIAVHDRPIDGAAEELPADHPEVKAFRGVLEEAAVLREGLSGTDFEVARVIEDVVDALLRRGLLQPDDLPSPALMKITQRREMRGRLRSLIDVSESEHDRLI